MKIREKEKEYEMKKYNRLLLMFMFIFVMTLSTGCTSDPTNGDTSEQIYQNVDTYLRTDGSIGEERSGWDGKRIYENQDHIFNRYYQFIGYADKFLYTAFYYTADTYDVIVNTVHNSNQSPYYLVRNGHYCKYDPEKNEIYEINDLGERIK